MIKLITCGELNPNYKYILYSIIFLGLYKTSTGFGFDGNKELSTQFFKNGKFGYNYLIHEIFLYLVCIIVSCILILIEKKCIFEKKNDNNEIKENNVMNILPLTNANLSEGSISLLYTKTNEEKYSRISVLFIIFIEILVEQFNLIFVKFFTHISFWMFELYFTAYLYLKIFHIEIYKHHHLAFGINLISIFSVLFRAILTILEGNEEKALYVKYWWFIIIGSILSLIYTFFISYVFVYLKKNFNENFIPSSKILLFYGIIGFFVTLCLCIIFTFTPCGKKIENIHEIKDYICKVVNNENQTYIDNLKVYFKENWENSDYDTKRDEILTNIFQSFSFAIYKYWSYKIIECLNPFHRIFSGSFYYILQQTIFFIVNSNKIINNEDIYLKYKILLDLLEDFLNVLTFLIYTEIIELNFCKFNYNLRKNIILRGIINDSSLYDLDAISVNSENGEEENQKDDEIKVLD